MIALKSFLMNEIFDLRQEITSLKLQLQQQKLSESKTNFCENEEKIVIENLKSQITSCKTENKFLKEEMKSKKNILDEILHQNSQLLKFDHYFNDTTNKKENIREGKEYHNKLNHQQKKQLLKERTVLSKESQKSENKMHGKDQKKVFIVDDSMIKNITGTGISRENVIKMRPHPGATTIDICDYIKPELRQKPDVVIVHCGTNDTPNNINTVKKIKKLVKEIEESNQENIPQVVISSIIKRYDQDYNEEIQSFPTAQFLWSGYHKPYRLDISDKQGGLLIYIKAHLPSRLLSNHISPKDIQAIPFELNLRKEKWMFVCIYRPPKQDSQYFLDNLSLIIDHYSSIYDNHIILGDFNMEPKNPKLASFMNSFNLYNLIKSNTCFKGSGSCIDLILTNRKYCFKHTSTFETGLSDHHNLIYSMLKTTFKKEESKRFIYRDYENFVNTNF